MSQTRWIQYLAGGMAAAFLLLAGALLAIPLLIREPLTVVRPDMATMLVDEGQAGLRARIDISPAGYFELQLLAPQSGQAGPPVRFSMPSTTMDPVVPDLESIGNGRFRAVDRLPTPGRWRFQLGEDGALVDMEFMLAEF